MTQIAQNKSGTDQQIAHFTGLKLVLSRHTERFRGSRMFSIGRAKRVRVYRIEAVGWIDKA